jgi:hypothetical protein
MRVYYFVPFICNHPYPLSFKWSLTPHLPKIGHVCMNFFYHTDQGSYFLQLCPQVMNHPVYVYGQYKEMFVTRVTSHSPHTSVMVHVVLLFI